MHQELLDKTRVSQLLIDSIKLLSRNGVSFKQDLVIDGLIALTVDSSDVVVVPIRETIKATIEATKDKEVEEEEEDADHNQPGNKLTFTKIMIEPDETKSKAP